MLVLFTNTGLGISISVFFNFYAYLISFTGSFSLTLLSTLLVSNFFFQLSHFCIFSIFVPVILFSTNSNYSLDFTFVIFLKLYLYVCSGQKQRDLQTCNWQVVYCVADLVFLGAKHQALSPIQNHFVETTYICKQNCFEHYPYGRLLLCI